MIRAGRWFVVPALFRAPASPPRVPTGQPWLPPYQMVRSLQLVQDRIAAGDHAALPIQRKLLN